MHRPRPTLFAIALLLGGIVVTLGATASAAPNTRTYKAAAFQVRAERAPVYDGGLESAWNHPEQVVHHGPEVENIAHNTLLQTREAVLEGNAWTPTGATGWMTLATPDGSFRVPVTDGRFAVLVQLRPGRNDFTLRAGQTQSRFALRYQLPRRERRHATWWGW